MAATQQLTHPLQTLREHISALDSAITLSLADPKPRPVHHLRTSTRRIEALLALFELLPELPAHKASARTAGRLLRKLRRAAGAVRDLDVQGDLLENLEASILQSSATAAAASQPGQLGSAALAQTVPPRHLHNHAKRLGKAIKRRRDREAKALVHILGKLQSRIAPALGQLLDQLSTAGDLTLTPDQFASFSRTWYQHHTPTPEETAATGDPDLLHAIRKSAKLARYIAEIPGSAETSIQGSAPVRKPVGKATANAVSATATSQIAASFESLQHAGGAWHDLLTLSEIARHQLGKHSPLTLEVKAACRHALKQYRHSLLHTPVSDPNSSAAA